MEKQYGYAGRILKIDVSSREHSLYAFSKTDYEKYLGGKIMAAKIVSDLVPPSVGAFDAENVMVVSTGPFTGSLAPTSHRFNVSAISPATNLLASSNCGGDFGARLKGAGYDALIITGKSERKIWIEISSDEIAFHDADLVWGQTVSETQRGLSEKTSKGHGQLVIGPAGENKVLYAGIFSGDRTAGRAGLGAVMGDKNIKGIVANGHLKPEIHNPEKWVEYRKKWIGVIKNHHVTGHALPKLGSAMLSTVMNQKGTLATKNYTYGTFAGNHLVSGEALFAKHLIKNKGCACCPIQCGRVVEFNGKHIKGPEFETLGLLGANLLNDDLAKIIEWNYLADEMGLDTISLGNTIGFAMELNELGAWENGLEFGKVDKISSLIEDIAYRRGIGHELADGVKRLSDKYGHSDKAVHAKGLECSAYEPRKSKGMALGYAVSNRGGCHLNGGYSILPENALLNVNPLKEHRKATLVAFMQNLMEAVSASGNCLFAMMIMLPSKTVEKQGNFLNRLTSAAFNLKITDIALNYLNMGGRLQLNIDSMIPHPNGLRLITGRKISLGEFLEIGNRGYTLERYYNTRRGLIRADDRLPGKMLHIEVDPKVPRSKVNLEYMKDKYYKTRRYDSNGVPTEKVLKALGLSF